jgi:hypothetical protein
LASPTPEKENQWPKIRSSITPWESRRFKSGGNRFSALDGRRLSGARILVVEDDFLILTKLETAWHGACRSVGEALRVPASAGGRRQDTGCQDHRALGAWRWAKKLFANVPDPVASGLYDIFRNAASTCTSDPFMLGSS